MTFTKINEALLQVDEYQSVRYVIEAQVSKRYETALDALANMPHDTVSRFIILNVETLSTRDVTEEMAKAYVDKFEPEQDEHVPPFVEGSKAYTAHIEGLEKPADAQREWGTLNHAQTGVSP